MGVACGAPSLTEHEPETSELDDGERADDDVADSASRAINNIPTRGSARLHRAPMALDVRVDGALVRTNGFSAPERFDLAFNRWAPSEELSPMTACGSDIDAAYYAQLGTFARDIARNPTTSGILLRNGLDDDHDGTVDGCSDATRPITMSSEGIALAIHEPPAPRAVVVNGHRFTPNDLAVLTMLGYAGTNAEVTVRSSCLEGCSALSAGLFHRWAVEMLARRGEAFGIELPRHGGIRAVVGFEVLERRPVALAEWSAVRRRAIDGAGYARFRTRIDLAPREVLGGASLAAESLELEYLLEVKDGEIENGEFLDEENAPGFLIRYRRPFRPNSIHDLGLVRAVVLAAGEVPDGAELQAATVVGALGFGSERPVELTLDLPARGATTSLIVGMVIDHARAADLRIALVHDGRTIDIDPQSVAEPTGIYGAVRVPQRFERAGGAWTLRVRSARREYSGRLHRFSIVARTDAN